MKRNYRKERVIPSLSRVTYPRSFLFFDTETYSIITDSGQFEQHLKVGVAKYILRDKQQNIVKYEERVFYTSQEILDFIASRASKSNKLYIYAHNIAFDLMVIDIFNQYHNQGIHINPPIQNSMLFLWSVKHPNGNLSFINTGNYVPYPLSKIGEDLGYPKLDIDFEHATLDQLITYCRRDVEIIQQFIFEFIQFLIDNDLGTYKTTIASQAFSVYRYKFMKHQILIHNNLSVNTVERDSYLGGRTEAFYIGEVPENTIYGLDINSMYPHVMKQGNIPVEFRSYIRKPDIKTVPIITDNNYVIADCIINTPIPFHGIKWNPNRYSILNSEQTIRGRKLIFPVGQYRDYLHHDEFIYALSKGFIQHIYGLYTYRSEDIFSDYVDFFNEIKMQATIENNQTQRLMSKLYLNSLYGKFGQLFRDTIKIAENKNLHTHLQDVHHVNTSTDYIDFQWFDDIYRELKDGEATYSFPAIAGCITSRARLLLWHYMERVGLENVYYCDTDSIYTNETGYLRLLSDCSPTELGKLKLEEELTTMVINGAKDYIKDGKRVVKGVPKNASWLNEKVSISTRFEGWKEYRNKGMASQPLVWQQLKIKTLPYDKGIIRSDNRVIPYLIQSKSVIQ